MCAYFLYRCMVMSGRRGDTSYLLLSAGSVLLKHPRHTTLWANTQKHSKVLLIPMGFQDMVRLIQVSPFCCCCCCRNLVITKQSLWLNIGITSIRNKVFLVLDFIVHLSHYMFWPHLAAIFRWSANTKTQ
jgi:hypothetical protein